MRDQVLCPACTLDDNVRSIVRLVESCDTGEPVDEFWDELGEYHYHTLTLDLFVFECSRGHVWDEGEPRYCWCEDDDVPTWRERAAIAHDACE